MSTIYDLTAPDQVPPHPPGPGAGGPGDSGGAGHGAGSPGGLRPHRRVLVIAAAAGMGGFGVFWGLQATASTTGAVLTTAQIAAKVDPGLVDIVSTLGYQQGTSAGTGIVLTSSGEVLTNNHVINGATSIKVTDIGNGRTYTAKVVGYDQSHDLAVLQLTGASGLKTVPLGNSAAVKVGQTVTALGNAGGKGGTPSAATGKITGVGVSISAYDQSTGTAEQLTGLVSDNANIQAGDSGGPLVNTAGQVIGLNTAAASGSQSQSGQAGTQAFAVPINEAVSIARQIEAGTSSSTVHVGATGFLGVETVSAADGAANGVPGTGATVAGVVSASPAAKAGLAAGDVIVSVDGHSVSSSSSLQSELQRHHPGDRVRITWTDQAGQQHTATVVLATGPAA